MRSRPLITKFGNLFRRNTRQQRPIRFRRAHTKTIRRLGSTALHPKPNAFGFYSKARLDKQEATRTTRQETSLPPFSSRKAAAALHAPGTQPPIQTTLFATRHVEKEEACDKNTSPTRLPAPKTREAFGNAGRPKEKGRPEDRDGKGSRDCRALSAANADAVCPVSSSFMFSSFRPFYVPFLFLAYPPFQVARNQKG